MPSLLAIPEEYQSGIISILNMTDDTFEAFLNGLETIEPTFHSKSLARQVAKNLPQLAVTEAENIIQVIVSLYRLQYRIGASTGVLIDDVAQAISSNAGVEIPEEKQTEFKLRMTQLLDFGGCLAITAKAMNVMLDNENVFVSARIMTDVRPVFREDIDPEELPDAAVIVNMLRITYHLDDEHKNFYVALDSLDIEALRDALDRADAKMQSAQNMLSAAHVPHLDINEDE